MQLEAFLSPTRVFTVGELTIAIQAALSMTFPATWVSGEVSGLKKHQNGHLYFTLKDSQATMPCVVWRTASRLIESTPKDGDQVEAFGRLDLYPPHGRYQFITENIRPRGRGELYAALERLKAQLLAEGLFDTARKRPLPPFPRRIGVVTSPTGAALRDLLKIILSRDPRASVLISPALVQGRGAAASICSALDLLAKIPDVDVVIVGRGGGSIEDLWAFNEEPVARAICAYPKPVVSAVGHESDFTISDLVADVRAATPSHAAELVTPQRALLEAVVSEAKERLLRAIRAPLSEAKSELSLLVEQLPDLRDALVKHRMSVSLFTSRLQAVGPRLLSEKRAEASLLQQRLAQHHPRAVVLGRRALYLGLFARLTSAYHGRLIQARERLKVDEVVLQSLRDRLQASSETRRDKSWDRLGRLAERLNALSPLGTLRRGYAAITPQEDTPALREAPPITRIASLQPGQRVRLRMHDGDALCRVETLQKKAQP